jgi:hypothetical protein
MTQRDCSDICTEYYEEHEATLSRREAPLPRLRDVSALGLPTGDKKYLGLKSIIGGQKSLTSAFLGKF